MTTPTSGTPGDENPYGVQPPGAEQPAGPPAYPQPSYPQPGSGQPGYPPPSYPQPGAPQAGYPAPSYPQPGYPQQGWQAGYGVPDTSQNGLGVWALVLGIAGWVCSLGFLAGIPAIVLGTKSRKAAAEGRATNGGMGTAGLVLGWVITILSVIAVVVIVLLLANGTLETTSDGSSFEWHLGS